MASEEDVFAASARGSVDTHVNPHGIWHEVVTVRRADGCVARGQPTTEHSWFPGWAWSFAHCASCGDHLGWRFDPIDRGQENGVFFGLRLASVRLG